MQRDDKKESPHSAAERLFRTGLHHLKTKRLREAKKYFTQALKLLPDEPRCLSYLGLCVALQDSTATEAEVLCEYALQQDAYRPELYCNLGRVYLLLGKRRLAHQCLKKDLALDSHNREIRRELETMGVRKPPVFQFLKRTSALNRYSGKLLRLLRLR